MNEREYKTEDRPITLVGYALDTKGEVLVEIIFLFPRVRKRDSVERKDRRRKFMDILKVEPERSRCLYFLDKTGSLHLVDDLLLRLGLLDQVRVRTRRSDEPRHTRQLRNTTNGDTRTS